MPECANDYRVVVFGTGGVGKTSLVLRFINGTFNANYIPTIEDTYRKVNFYHLQIQIQTLYEISKGHAFNNYTNYVFQVISSNRKEICTLQITDTTGSHQFPAMQRLSISKGHAFILVFSIASRQSLEELKSILELVNEVKKFFNTILVICIYMYNHDMSHDYESLSSYSR